MSGGVPPSSRAGVPKLTRSQLGKAADLYTRFSGHDAEAIAEIDVPPMPAVGIAIGTVDAIEYTTVRDGEVELYRHDFHKTDRPLFVVSPDGRVLLMVGGDFRFTERGIVDKHDV